MGIFNKNKGTNQLTDVIRCDEPSYLIWKWHPTGSQPGNNSRENAIRWGSSLRVKDGEVAVFVYKQKDGPLQDFIIGPFDQTIKTANFPVLTSIVGLPYAGDSPFQAEVYFINLARIIQVRFGVPFFDVFDPRFEDFSVPVAVRGTLSFKIGDYREFIKLHRLTTFNLEDFLMQIRDAIVRYVKDVVANAPSEYNIPVIQIERKTAQIHDAVEQSIVVRLREDFGVIVSGIDIGAIDIDKTADGYLRLMAVTRDLSAAGAQAHTEANVKHIHEMQRITDLDYEEKLRITREEDQYARRMQSRSKNFFAYQTEVQAEVGVASANALGQMNASVDGTTNIGGGTGFNPAAMMVGVAMGSTLGQNLANTMNTAMSGIHAPVQPGTVPPPIPTVAYHVAINGKDAGAFSLVAMKEMIHAGTLTKDSLVWKDGMETWEKAGSVPSVQALFNSVVPPILETES